MQNFKKSLIIKTIPVLALVVFYILLIDIPKAAAVGETFEQAAYGWFVSTDTPDVSTPLAGQDATSTAPVRGTPFRLRMDIHIAGANFATGTQSFKLQFAQRSGTCDAAFTGESYSDLSATSGAIRYYDNSTVIDGSLLTDNANDPVHSSHTNINQVYVESNNFTSTSTIVVGEDGLWDFSLYDFSAPTSTAYCFRVVKSDDTLLDTYSVIPEITSASQTVTVSTVTLAATSPAWSHSKQRNVFYNGSNYFLLYASSTSIAYKASSDNISWTATSTLVADNTSSSFDVYLVNDTKFDIVYSNGLPKVKTCTISGQSVSCDSGSSSPLGAGIGSMTVIRTPSADRIFMITRNNGELEVWSAGQTGDASNVLTWTDEVAGADSFLAGEVSAVPYKNSDQVLVIYQRNPGGTNSDGVYSRAISQGSGAGTQLEIGNLNDMGTLSNPVRISDTDFRYILKKTSGSADSMVEYQWNGSSWSILATIDAETDQESPSLFYDAVSGDMYVFSVDTSSDDIEGHRKPSGGSWAAEFVLDSAEATTHTNPVVAMQEPSSGSSRTTPRQLVWAYQVANATGFDLKLGNLLLSPSFEQSAFRFFENADSNGVGDNPLAAQSATATLSTSGQAFRLRALVHSGSNSLQPAKENFKLQYALRVGTCDLGFSGETYADVTGSSAIAFRNNLAVAAYDGAFALATSTDPTHSGHSIVRQTYEEANNFTSTSTIPSGQDGLWDFSLYDNSGSAANYCLRIVKSDGGLLDSYLVIPEVLTFSGISIVSAANQVFEINQSATAISQITITDFIGSITDANDLRIAIATSTANILWDTIDTSAVFGGTAASKVSTISYEGNGSVLVVAVDTDFVSGDTLTISGLSYANFTAVNPAVSALQVFKDGSGDQSSEANDSSTVTVKGKLSLTDHEAGQLTNKLQSSSTSITDEELLQLKLVPTGESQTIGSLVVMLSGVIGFNSSHISQVTLYIDYDSDEVVDVGEDTVGGTGSVSITGSSGTITFSQSFTATTSRNYILQADVNSIQNGDEFTMGINSSDISVFGDVSLETIFTSGLVTSVRHIKISRSGGGGPSGGGPGGSGQKTGGGAGGGDPIEGGSGGGGQEAGGGEGGGSASP